MNIQLRSMCARQKALNGDNRAFKTLVGLARVHNNGDADERRHDQHLAPEDQAILDAFADGVRSRPPANAEGTPPTPSEPEAGVEPEGDGNE